MKYFWYIDGKSKGPYTPGEAAEILGGISPDTLVCHESDNPDSPGSWHKFSKLPEIVNSWDPEDFKSQNKRYLVPFYEKQGTAPYYSKPVPFPHAIVTGGTVYLIQAREDAKEQTQKGTFWLCGILP